jgi:hypothetical protein
VEHVVAAPGAPERRACRVLGQHRSTQRMTPKMPADEAVYALSAKRTNKTLAGFVRRMLAAGKPKKVILIAVARKLLVYAHAVIRTQKPFNPVPGAHSPA